MDALSSKNALPIVALVRLEQFTSSAQVAPFYGQSLSLVRMLAQQKSPETLIEFAKDSIDKGIEGALNHHYQIERVKRFIGFVAGASASKALTASATIKQAFVEFWW